MYPILFRIGSFEVTSFGVMVAAAGLVGLWLFRHELRRSGLPVDATDAGIAGVIAGHGRSAGRHSERRRGTAGGCDPHSHRLCRRPDSVRYGSISSVARIPRDGVSAGSAQLERETVGTHSLLYTWRGSESSLDAILLAGHLDVVPVEPGTETKWQQDPFSGRIADGFIWGRGAIDNKSAVIGILEAIEMLLGEGFRPARTLYLAYGHDEEVGGTGGAREIATVLKARGVALEMVLDEGGVIGDDLLAGISEPVALVGSPKKASYPSSSAPAWRADTRRCRPPRARWVS